MKTFLHLLIAGLAYAGEAPPDELSLLAQVRDQQEHCAHVHEELGPLSGFADASGWSLRGSGHYKLQHDHYEAKLGELKSEAWYSEWEKSLGAEAAGKLGETCAKRKLALKPLCGFLGGAYSGCQLVDKIQKNKSWLEGGEHAAQERIDVLEIADKAAKGQISEVRQETVYSLRLKTYKSQATLNVGKHIANSMDAQYNDVIVGEDEYNRRYDGEVLSSKFNVVGLFKKDSEFSSYKVAVDGHDETSTYLVVETGGKVRPVSESIYEGVAAELKAKGTPVQGSDSSGVHSIVILGKPKNRTEIVKVEPKIRYFVNVQIKTSSFTTDLSRKLENHLTANEIELEVPKETYQSQSSVFSPDFNGAALLTRGTFDTLHGTILSRRKEADANAVEITLRDGRKLTIPKAELADYQRVGDTRSSVSDSDPVGAGTAR